jgi:transposase
MTKRKYTHVSEYETIILSMRQAGCTRREIADELGLSIKQIETWITRYNKRESLLLAGKERRVRGRPRKDGKPLQERPETELKRLRMENKLLRDFLQFTERM